jgi:hypothetical protein
VTNQCTSPPGALDAVAVSAASQDDWKSGHKKECATYGKQCHTDAAEVLAAMKSGTRMPGIYSKLDVESVYIYAVEASNGADGGLNGVILELLRRDVAEKDLWIRSKDAELVRLSRACVPASSLLLFFCTKLLNPRAA